MGKSVMKHGAEQKVGKKEAVWAKEKGNWWCMRLLGRKEKNERMGKKGGEKNILVFLCWWGKWVWCGGATRRRGEFQRKCE